MAISIAMVAAARSDEVGGPKLAEAMAASLTNAVLVDTGDVQQIDNLNTDKLSVQTPFWAAVEVDRRDRLVY